MITIREYFWQGMIVSMTLGVAMNDGYTMESAGGSVAGAVGGAMDQAEVVPAESQPNVCQKIIDNGEWKIEGQTERVFIIRCTVHDYYEIIPISSICNNHARTVNLLASLKIPCPKAPAPGAT